MRTQDIGALGESIAADRLKKSGYRILERNRHESHNEIDIIAANREFILFVEVKTRTMVPGNAPMFSAASAVTRAKQVRLLQAASQYLRKHPRYYARQPRLDVIEVYLDVTTHAILEINHIENAFGR